MANIILLNLLIAILSNTYNKIMERSNMEYALIVFKDYNTKRIDKYFSFMMLFPAPINIFSFLISPYLLKSKSK